MSTLFVTATGTGVGKTLLATVLVRQLRDAGHAVRALKPVATGCDEDLADTDGARLLAASGMAATREHLASITPWAYAAALSPDMAAAREGRSVPFDALVEWCRAQAEDGVPTLIEGIGGVMVPLDGRHTVLDWIAALDAPALLVAGSYLGTLSHTLTAAGMLRARGCALAGIVVSESEEQPVPPEETAGVLSRFLAHVPVRVLPRLADGDASAAPSLLALVEPWLAKTKNRG